MRFEFSRRALRQVERIHAWWTDHRPEARSLFLDELSKVEAQLRANPELGKVHATQVSGEVRRLLLRETEYHLYYRYIARRDELTVLSVWGATRGRTPRL